MPRDKEESVERRQNEINHEDASAPGNIAPPPPPSRASGMLMIAIVAALLAVCAVLYLTSAPEDLPLPKQTADDSQPKTPARPVPKAPETPGENAPAANTP